MKKRVLKMLMGGRLAAQEEDNIKWHGTLRAKPKGTRKNDQTSEVK